MKSKRVLSICLAAVLVLNLFVLFPAFAVTDPASDHLVVHYDFLGDTLEEQLRDKAPAGTVSDDLTLVSGGNRSGVQNGVLNIDEAFGNYAQVAKLSTDVTSATALTFYTRFKFEGENPYNLVDMVMMNGFLRWSIPVNGTLSATFTTAGGNVGLGGGTIYTPGQWIDMALTISYDAANKTVTGKRYVSVDGWKNYIPTETAKNCATNPMATITNMILGKNNTGMGDRGRSVSFEDFRIYDTALDISDIRTVTVEKALAATDFSHLDNYLITHYDFLGLTEAEQLRDKGTAGSVAENLTVSTTLTNGINDTYIKDGVAYVNHKQNNYLRAANIGDIKNITSSMTIFMEFKADIAEYINVGDPLNIGHTARIGYFVDMNNHSRKYIYPAAGKNNSGGGEISATNMPEGFENGWIRVAYVSVYDKTAGTVAITLYYSTDNGATWASSSRTAMQGGNVDLTTMYSGATELLLGKVAAGIADRGISFCYNDVRVYNKALTKEEIASISPEAYRDLNPDNSLAAHYDFIGNTPEEMLTDKVSGNKITLGDTTGTACAESGTVKVDNSKGNYLYLKNLPQIMGKDGSMTVFSRFRLEGAPVGNTIAELLSISNTFRFGFYQNTFRPLARVGTGLPGASQTTGDAQANLTQNKWIELAAVLYDDGNKGVSAYIYYSVDDGKTWTVCAATGYTGVSMAADGASLMLGKLSMGAESNNGVSVLFDDVRIYSSALSMEQLKAIRVYDSPDISGAGMDLTRDLSLNYYVPVSVAEQYETITATAVCLGETFNLVNAGTVTLPDGKYICFRYTDVSALTLGADVTVTLNAVRNGKVWHGASATYSVKDYCYSIIRSSDASAQFKTLCVDILNYGAAAQTYFAYETDMLVNSGLTDAEKALGSTGEITAKSVADTKVSVIEDALVKFRSASVNLRNPIEMRFKLATEEPLENLTVVVTDLSGNVLDVISMADAKAEGTGVVSVGTSCAGMRDAVLVAVWKNYGAQNAEKVSNTIRYSIESYAAGKVNSSNPALSELVKAMLRYGDALSAVTE